MIIQNHLAMHKGGFVELTGQTTRLIFG